MKCFFMPLLLSALSLSTSWAQKAFIYNSLQKNGFVSVSIGSSMPTGRFGKITNCTQEEGSGMAVLGRSLSLSGGYRLAGPLGIMGRFETVTNAIQAAGLADQYPQLAGDGFKATASAGRDGQWQSHSIMVGPYVTVPLGRVALDIRAMAGQTWATCPETCVQGNVNNVETSFRSGNQVSTAIGSSVGLTIRYRLTPVLGLHVNTDYNSATFRFNNVPLVATSGNSIYYTAYTSVHTLSMLNMSGGLTLQFRSKNRVL